MTNKLAEINAVIEKYNRFLITSHMDPDGDSIGSQMALYYSLLNRGKIAAVVNQGSIPAKYRFLDSDNIIKFSSDKLPYTPEVVIVLECPSLDRIGFVRELIPESAILLNIDHHNDTENYARVNIVDKESSAVAEILYFLFEEDGSKITPEIAKQLYAAISSDTGRFRFGSTTSRSMYVASKLIEKGANPKEIADNLYSGMAPGTIKLLGYTLASLKIEAGGKIGYFAITRENLRKSGAMIENSEGFVDFILSINGVRMGFLFKELSDGVVKVSVRSQNGYDSAEFASLFNGGGHTNAAGFSKKGEFGTVVNNIIEKAREYIRECN
ncbi:MAG: bifunctional oligoribonuclease/PAP phosphatase NrnA [Candidatus Zixiibacteriota bacterium]|nr:MAG: bifunctional oligoribonuclease/PAP phosphatase NrnA [candidate division Zixibacteria bacterium]